MKMTHRVILMLLLFAGSSFLYEGFGQSASMRQIKRRSHRNERSLGQNESKKVKRAKEKAIDQKEEQKEKYEKAKEKDIEHRQDLQTPETKERMKESRKKADEFNNRGREPFFKRLFKHKKHNT